MNRTRLGGPDGEILCEKVINPVCSSCRALMARGITGPFETRKPGIPSACMRGDIEATAALTVYEPDDQDNSRPVHFTKWRPFDQSARDRLSTELRVAPASDRGSAGSLPLEEIA